jgi:hypothetical protein
MWRVSTTKLTHKKIRYMEYDSAINWVKGKGVRLDKKGRGAYIKAGEGRKEHPRNNPVLRIQICSADPE